MFGAPGSQSPRILGGRYRLLKIAGKGGMGVVWKAWDESVQRQVAVKLVLPAHTEDEHLQRLARLERERRVLIELSQHPNVVTLFDILMEPIGYVMEWLEGYDLEAWLHANPGPRPPEVVASIFAPMLDAVGYAHERGVIHRDLKSSNVYLQALGDRVTVRVMDFGLARIVLQESNITTGRLLVGTPQYMAPEQVLDQESTPATDIYALGVLLYECLTGMLPLEDNNESPIPMLLFKANNELPPAREKYPELPEALEAVITKATRRDPKERFASCAEFAEALFAALPTMPNRTRPLIEASSLGVLPEIAHLHDASSLLTPPDGENDTGPLSESALYGYVSQANTTSRLPQSSSNVTAVTAAPPSNEHATAATAALNLDDAASRPRAWTKTSVIRTLKQKKKQFLDAALEIQLAIGAVALVSLLLLLLLPVALFNNPKQTSENAPYTTLEKYEEPLDDDSGIHWILRGPNSQSATVTNALRDYKRTLAHWNAGRRTAIIDGHRETMRCYYNIAGLPRARVPVHPLVRASLGLPLAPFYPIEIYVTNTGRDYVTFVERGVAGENKEHYTRVIQMAGGRKAKWRVSVESNETAHSCYESFDTHFNRWKEAGPIASD